MPYPYHYVFLYILVHQGTKNATEQRQEGPPHGTRQQRQEASTIHYCCNIWGVPNKKSGTLALDVLDWKLDYRTKDKSKEKQELWRFCNSCYDLFWVDKEDKECPDCGGEI